MPRQIPRRLSKLRRGSPSALVPDLTFPTGIKLNSWVLLRPVQTRLAWLQVAQMANCFGLRTARLGAACPHGRPRLHFFRNAFCVHWSSPFEDPIILPDGRKLLTLKMRPHYEACQRANPTCQNGTRRSKRWCCAAAAMPWNYGFMTSGGALTKRLDSRCRYTIIFLCDLLNRQMTWFDLSAALDHRRRTYARQEHVEAASFGSLLSDRGHDRDARLAVRIRLGGRWSYEAADYQLIYWINCIDLYAAQPIIPHRAKFICNAFTIASLQFLILETQERVPALRVPSAGTIASNSRLCVAS